MSLAVKTLPKQKNERSESPHFENMIDREFARIKSQKGYLNMGMPKETSFLGSISEAFSNLSKLPIVEKIKSVVSPISKITTLIASSAIVTSVLKTAVDAAVDSAINLDPSKFAQGLTKAAFISNAYSCGWGLLIFAILFPIARMLIHDQELQFPPLPPDHKSAIKAGITIGKASAVSAATWGAGTSLIARYAPTGITNWIFKGLTYWGYWKMLSYFL